MLPSVVATPVDSKDTPPSLTPELTAESQHIHLQLYEGTLEIYRERETRKLRIADITELTRSADQTIHLRYNTSSISSPPLCYQFHGPQLADTFQQYVEYWQDSGSVLQKAFDLIDQHKQGFITPDSLLEVMHRQGLVSLLPDTPFNSIQDVHQMLTLTTPPERIRDTSTFDYIDFFQVFLDIPMHSLYGCLVEWKAQAQTQTQEKVQSQIQLSTELASPCPPPPLPPQIATRAVSQAETVSYTLLPGETVANMVNDVKWYLGGTTATVASAMSTLATTHRGIPNGQQTLTSVLPKEGVFCPPFLFGRMVITNYRVMLLARRCVVEEDGTKNRYGIPTYFHRMEIPLCCMAQITLTSLSKQAFGYPFNR